MTSKRKLQGKIQSNLLFLKVRNIFYKQGDIVPTVNLIERRESFSSQVSLNSSF